MNRFIHPSAIIEDQVSVGRDTKIWDAVHIRKGASIGDGCIVGGKSYLAPGVKVGNRVKINSFVYICSGVTIEDGVMVSAGTIFTNDRFPRATTPDLTALLPSEPDEHTLPTLVREGATIGAGSVIGNDLVVGRFAMIGMGGLVTKNVPDFHLAVGHPVASVGCVCRCGKPIARFSAVLAAANFPDLTCPVCRRRYCVTEGQVIERLTAAEFQIGGRA